MKESFVEWFLFKLNILLGTLFNFKNISHPLALKGDAIAG
jgi:hypothetical protein